METPEIGDIVRIKSVVGCSGEYKAHGMNPYVQGQVGIVVPPRRYVSPPTDHPWRIQFKGGFEGLPFYSYFVASELELIAGDW